MGCYRKALSSKGRYVRPRDYYGIVSHFYQVVINKASFGILADSSSEGTAKMYPKNSTDVLRYPINSTEALRYTIHAALSIRIEIHMLHLLQAGTIATQLLRRTTIALHAYANSNNC